MKKYVNVLCVLILALMLIDLIIDFLYTGGSSIAITLDLLFILLVILGAAIVCMVCFIKFILNVNRNEVFTRKNISLLRKYGVCALLIGVCIIFIDIAMQINVKEVVTDGIDSMGEGLFALLMGEVFGIGMNLQEGKSTAA